MMLRRTIVSLTVLAAYLVVPAVAAQDTDSEDDASPEVSETRTDDSEVDPGVDRSMGPTKITLAFGVKGGPQFQGATEVPEDITYRANNTTYDYVDTNVYGEFGVGGGVGPAVELRIEDTWGLESGFYFTADNARGKNDITSEEGEDLGAVTQVQTTGAFHIPVLFKLSPPFDNIRPVLGLGLEFVVQRNSDLSYEYSGEVADDHSRAVAAGEPLPEDRNRIETTNYTTFLATAGVEFDAGPVRIPLELRVGYNLGWNEGFNQRVHVENPKTADEKFVYNGEYLGHFGIYTGVEYRWDFTVGQEGPGADGPDD